MLKILIMNEYKSTKLFDGYSVAFRQWRAKHSHCQYAWICNEIQSNIHWSIRSTKLGGFGSFKRNGIKEHMSYMFDHTTVVVLTILNFLILKN